MNDLDVRNEWLKLKTAERYEWEQKANKAERPVMDVFKDSLEAPAPAPKPKAKAKKATKGDVVTKATSAE